MTGRRPASVEAARSAANPFVDATAADMLAAVAARFPDRSFDIVYSRHSFEHAFDKHKAGSEFLRVLRDRGVVVIEAVFGWPGIGLQAWTAIRNQDTPMIMGTVLFASIAVVFLNLFVDLLYVALDPRVRLTT